MAMTVTVIMAAMTVLGMMGGVGLGLGGNRFVRILIAVPVQPPLEPEEKDGGQGGADGADDKQLHLWSQNAKQRNQGSRHGRKKGLKKGRKASEGFRNGWDGFRMDRVNASDRPVSHPSDQLDHPAEYSEAVLWCARQDLNLHDVTH